MTTSEFGDCVGVESSADLKSDVGDAYPRVRVKSSHRGRRRDAVAKEFPPPISWLARTENQSSHMPWVMKKYYSDDGRLIIKEEKVKHHEYFLADRSNGRLVLNLVNLDDACNECHAAPKDAIEINGSNSGDEINGGDEEIGSPTREEVGGYNYYGMGVSPCGGFVTTAAAPVFRSPVHT
ncbi:hypothetical protein ACS0TY_023618 [Phlomoides rotata]